MRSLPALLLSAMLCTLLAACGSISPKETKFDKKSGQKEFKTSIPQTSKKFAPPDTVRTLESEKPFEYRIGPGDMISIKVWRRPELSQEGIVVSPDGLVTIPRVGSVQVLGQTIGEVQKLVTTRLENYYIKPEVTIRIQQFHNNKAFVLGRVTNPGVINFPGQGTLLEALALAGGLPHQGKETFLTKCAIIRGKDTVIWIDLQDLLNNGNMALNASIRNNDIIFIPEAEDEMVFVMGEVMTPGAIQLRGNMNVLKAIMLAGGMNKFANPEKVFIIRQKDVNGKVIKVNLKELLERADFARNFKLMSGDIVYVSPGGMAKLNYTIDKVLPAMQVFKLGVENLEALGIMQELRQKVWGQEGFINPSGE